VRQSPALALLRDVWWAASAPAGFFRARERDPEPRVWRAVVAAAAAVSVALAVLSLAFVRATASDGWALVWTVASLVGLPYLALALLLGGLVMVRPAELDVRAWEIAAWAWAPAGALAVSLAPAAYLVPLPAVAVGLLAFPFWHVIVLVHGVNVFARRRRLATTALYVVAVFLVPLLLTVVSFAVLSGMRP
jgi:hypothetical protein